ncbi:flagellar biosynthesis anti-sigma factor FlgM [Pigmentiphaga litoralis]|uniref:flagellar biosynthesis anti-sigma factor FlgM n=1 Tax=Pigmentiphaga litoralis TaxID=516702 RepID=UPI003B4347F0
MKITQKGSPPVNLTRNEPTEARMQAASSPSTATSESVHLSKLSSRLAGTSAGEAPVNLEHVERIKTAIKNGEFQVNAEAVADKMLEIERDTLGRQ